jgi:hypothetical protein
MWRIIYFCFKKKSSHNNNMVIENIRLEMKKKTTFYNLVLYELYFLVYKCTLAFTQFVSIQIQNKYMMQALDERTQL